jgi:uncharacterized protein involved in exopolysaccharide biosynthesis
MSTESEPSRDVRLPTLRDLLTPVFRYRVAGLATALGLFIVCVVLIWQAPKQYEAEMKILLKRERVDPVMSSDANASPQVDGYVTEDELNSEVELLKSRDLLEQVVRASRLHIHDGQSGGAQKGRPDEKTAVARAVEGLKVSLTVAPIRRTAMIRVTYRSTDPVRAAGVLSELSNLYLQKHLTVHRPAGAFDFFTKQAEHFQRELSAAETRLADYSRHADVVAADVERANTLQKLADFEAALQQTQGQIADATRRVADLEAQAAVTPARQTTQIRTSENAELTGQLKTRILALETRRADMLRKFTPTYPPVVELEAELTQARAALARTEQSPLTEETTDQNPTHQYLRGELARARTERAAASARASALRASVQVYQERARQLDAKASVQQDLKRSIRSAEDNFLLYRRKQEEARISDALDHTRIANAAVAEAPTVPTLPAKSGRFVFLLLAAALSLLAGLGVTYVLHYMTPYLHTPNDVETALDLPVLLTLSARR